MRAASWSWVWLSCFLFFAFSCASCAEPEESSDSTADSTTDSDTATQTDDPHGNEETATLYDGTEVKLPMYFKARDGIMILGTCAKDALLTLQRSLDTHTPVEQSGRGICFLWYFDYLEDSDLGAYTEIAITHMATPSETPIEPDFDITDFGSLAANFTALLERVQIVNSALWLTSDLGIAAGEQIWGYPKLKGQFSDTFEEGEDGPSYRAVEVVETKSGKMVASFRLSIPTTMVPVSSFPRQEGLTTGTWDNTNGPHKLISRMENVESIAIGAWDEEKDELELGSGTWQLDMLQALDFQPLGTLVYGGFDLYLEAPTDF